MALYKRILTALAAAVAATAVSATSLPTWDSGKPAQHCQAEWTKRGVLDQTMYDFCMNMERESYEDLTDLVARYSEQPWIEAALDHSVAEWSKRGVIQFSMVKFQLEQIAEGFEDIVYLSQQPGWDERKYQRCSRNWGVQFNMVVFCYEN